MKVMDGSTESDNCATTVPPKKKKLIQARLPFQMLGSSASPNKLLNKKRKNMSPSPGECRNSKIVKTTSKENSAEEKVSDPRIGETVSRKDDVVEIVDNSSVVRVSSLEDTGRNVENDEAPDREKKNDVKAEKKPGAITRFLQKVGTPRKDMPVVLLTRCDSNSDGEFDCPDRAVVQSLENVEKLVTMKSDESSNEELAKELEDSEDDNALGKERSDASSDVPAGNSDSDSIVGISSSSEDDDVDNDDDDDDDNETDDNETDENKRNNDNDRSEDKGTVNGTSLQKTPTSAVKSEGGTSAARRKLTPKQLEKKMETTKRREERRMERIEKEKKREEEKLLRQKEKETRRREKKEKEEAEREQKRKEKEQKELKRQMEIEQKQREKERRDKAKEEDRRKREEAKEEEKRKKEEERLEAERKKQKAASTFVSFFVPKKPETRVIEEEKLVRTSNFMPFEVKADMRVAPVSRRSLSDTERTRFDMICVDKLKDTEQLYVNEIKVREKRKSGKTWPPESKDDVVVIEDGEVGSCNMVDQTNSTIEKQRVKLLAFAENRRPPYWGTWRKRSAAVTPRRPFSKDTKWFDYDVDSDEEWEEEEPGESLRGSDDEKDEENPDDNEYDVDNEFMVPHGYLSDEEAQADEDEEDMSPETQKFKLKILGEEFEAERNTQTSKIKPKVVGCVWLRTLNVYPENIPQKLVDFLTARQAWVRETPIRLGSSGTGEGTGAMESASGEEKRGPKKTKVPNEALPELIRLIHGNIHGRGFLVKEFMTFWNRKKHEKPNPLSKSSVSQKIRELARRMACPEEGPMHLKACWYVPEETRREYLGGESLELPNTWNYALVPVRRTLTEATKIVDKSEKEEREKERKSVPLITQYTKKITQEEMKKQLEIKTPQISSPKAATSQAKPPRRAQLISVGRGEQFPKSSIVNAFTKSQISANSKQTAVTSNPENLDVSGDSSVTSDKNKMDEPMVVDLDSSTDDTPE